MINEVFFSTFILVSLLLNKSEKGLSTLNTFPPTLFDISTFIQPFHPFQSFQKGTKTDIKFLSHKKLKLKKCCNFKCRLIQRKKINVWSYFMLLSLSDYSKIPACNNNRFDYDHKNLNKIIIMCYFAIKTYFWLKNRH